MEIFYSFYLFSLPFPERLEYLLHNLKSKLIMKFNYLIWLLVISFTCFVGCTKQGDVTSTTNQPSLLEVELNPVEVNFNYKTLDEKFLVQLNKKLASVRSSGLDVELERAEYITAGDSDEMGQTVFFNNRGNRQLAFDFLVNDPRSIGGNLTVYAVDNTEGATTSGLVNATTEAAIDRAMATWESVNCSNPMIVKNPTNTDIGVVQAIFGFGGDGNSFYGDIQHGGWLPKAFFDILAPNGGNFILGVTFTFNWVQDLNEDGVAEVAFREIYYNDNFPWAVGANFDVETVALHEAGHGLSQAHFGKAFGTNSNGKVHFAPRAVMNAAYSGIQTTIKKTDNAGHCSLWANWPNN